MSDYPTLATCALMSDDVGLAIKVSTLSWKIATYIPLLNLPRLFRPDWRAEIQKRMVTLQRAGITKVFTKKDEAERIGGIFQKAGFDVVSAEHLLQTLHEQEGQPSVGNFVLNSLEDFALLCGYTKRLSNGGVEYLCIQNAGEDKQYSGGKLMVLETSSRVLDVSVVNYARYFGYDLKIIPELVPQFEKDFERILTLFHEGPEAFVSHKESLIALVSSVLGIADIQGEYEGVQLIVKDFPIGILFESIPAAHLFHVDAEMKLFEDIVELRMKPRDSFLPSYLFVDLQEDELQSEIPEVVSEISNQSQWRFHLNGRRATVAALRLFCQFFPIDFLMVSGHGGRPMVRVAEFEYKDENGNPHIIKVREFYQFLRVVEGKIEVESKYEFLSIDGVDWENKKEIGRRCLSIRGFLEKEENKLISSENVSIDSLEGLVLANGVFMGNIHFFANSGNPVLFLNTCGSLSRAGKLLSFAGARAIVGTAWSILDTDAVIFSKGFFNALKEPNLANAFFAARMAVINEYSKLSYWFVGTLNTVFRLGLDNFDIEEQKRIMALRMVSALEMANFLQEKGWMSKGDAQDLCTIFNIATAYCSKSPDTTRDVVVRVNRLRKEMESDT